MQKPGLSCSIRLNQHTSESLQAEREFREWDLSTSTWTCSVNIRIRVQNGWTNLRRKQDSWVLAILGVHVHFILLKGQHQVILIRFPVSAPVWQNSVNDRMIITAIPRNQVRAFPAFRHRQSPPPMASTRPLMLKLQENLLKRPAHATSQRSQPFT